MKLFFSAIGLTLLFHCNGPETQATITHKEPASANYSPWIKFLRSLPLINGQIKDYTGTPIDDQSKHYQLVNYDVGTRDLQQCADFLIRLRAEFLFAEKRFDEISFRFTSGQSYSFNSYCAGKTPVVSGNKVEFRAGATRVKNHASLRKYLDYVYAYAGTVSLNRDLRAASGFDIGTIIIQPGTPGHCMIIVDEQTINGERRYKLAESFMPAQTPYILKNPGDGTPWHQLVNGRPIRTSSFSFAAYHLKEFE